MSGLRNGSFRGSGLLSNTKTTVLFTGYQTGGTRGAKMQDGVDAVKIHGAWIPLRASVKVISGLSGHGDYLELSQWLQQSALADTTQIQLIHGDPDALEGLRVHLQEKTAFTVGVAAYRNILRL